MLTAQDIMTHEVVTVNENATVRELAALLLSRSISGAPVVDDAGKVIGVVSIGDLVKAVISEQGEQIEQLQRYIAG